MKIENRAHRAHDESVRGKMTPNWFERVYERTEREKYDWMKKVVEADRSEGDTEGPLPLHR